MRRGRPREPDADADERVGERDLPVRASLLPEQQHPHEGEEEERIAEKQRESSAAGCDQLGGPRGNEDHQHDRRQDRGARLDSRVAEHVLQVLLADERRGHQRTEHDDSGAGGHPERRSRGHGEVVEWVSRPPLTHEERDRRRRSDQQQAYGERSLVRHRREVDPEYKCPHQHDGEDAAEVVDRIVRLVDVRRHEHERHHERHPDEGQRHEEHRAPPEVLQQDPGNEGPERRNPAPDRRPERNRLRPPRPRPESGDKCERCRVRHACRDAAHHAGHEEHLVRRCIRSEERGRNRQHHPRRQHQLAPVPVAERSEPEHGPGETEEYPTAIRFSVVCDESNACPIAGSATFATDRFRFATAATRIRLTRTSVARAGPAGAGEGAPGASVMSVAVHGGAAVHPAGYYGVYGRALEAASLESVR